MIKETALYIYWQLHFFVYIRVYNEFDHISTANTRQHQQQHNQHEIDKDKQRFLFGETFLFCIMNISEKKISRVACECIKVQIQNKTDFKQPTNSCSIHWNGPNNGRRVYTKFKRVVGYDVARVVERMREREKHSNIWSVCTSTYKQSTERTLNGQRKQTTTTINNYIVTETASMKVRIQWQVAWKWMWLRIAFVEYTPMTSNIRLKYSFVCSYRWERDQLKQTPANLEENQATDWYVMKTNSLIKQMTFYHSHRNRVKIGHTLFVCRNEIEQK